ncbi:hypothetical protein CLIB1444_08S04478 [[Candida] jaroonii]|uniref:Uncharacterized protein n=1 Tax=[Candida] jaroonii TaxID=467808 RepID=A0ACA9YBQ8_9ASCO|nr:hypothetical protein CLIB1444_08S04478 [[Candida] jaroonii]
MSDQLKVVSSEPVELDDDKKTSPNTEEVKEEPKTEVKVESKDEKPQPIDKDEDAPPAPPRPVDPVTQLKKELKDAFPSIDDRLITGILIASQGDLDLSFNALLFISDESMEEPPIPVKPPVPSKAGLSNTKPELTDDEKLARQLQKEFEMEERRRRRRAKRQEQQLQDDDSPDEFEQIKQNFNQGLEEARSTLNGWISGVAKRFDNPSGQSTNSNQNPKLFGALGGSQFKKNKFDEDPEILDHNFHEKIKLNDNEEQGPTLPRRKTDQSINSNPAPVNSDAFLVDDSDDDDDKKDIKL